jgi:cell division septation protein DedD
MTQYRDRTQKEGLSARELVVLFLAGVAVCAVFFALGFVAGYNQRPSGYASESERVTGAGSVIPPTVNRPLEHDQAPAKTPAANPAEPETEQVSAPEPMPGPARAPAASQKTPSTPTAPSEPGGTESNARARSGVTLQVAATGSKKDAENLVSTLKGRGYPSFLVTPQEAHAPDNLFRVQVGPFPARQDAEKIQKKLRDEGFQPFFLH